MTESQISKDCETLLNLNNIPNWRVNVLDGQFKGYGEKAYRHVKTGTKGISDRQVLMTDGSGRTLYIEIKTPKGKQSKDQKDFEAQCIKLNVPYILVRSYMDLAEYLKAFGMLKVRF